MTMISLEDSAWSRSYAVWSQLFADLPIVMAGVSLPNGSQDAVLTDLRLEDRADPMTAAHTRPDFA